MERFGFVGATKIESKPERVPVPDRLAARGLRLSPFDSQAFEQRLERGWWPLLRSRYPDPPASLDPGRWTADQRAFLERAAGSEDAFDAAVSALVMSEHEAELRVLGPLADPAYGIEGKIWRPEPLGR